jgi:carbonic anhydrase/acetyltransferase-like protein (isoleucine patch superfamily)
MGLTGTGPIYGLNGVVPQLGRRVFVAPNATVIGDVVIGDESSIWFGTVLRGDAFPIRVGARTNVQDNAVVHITGGKAATTIGDDVTVGHLALVHGCTIGHRCLIGMGSIVLDGAVIEDDCLVAAGALIPPGMRVPARSLVMGRPGKVVRAITDADVLHIREAAAAYVAHASEYVTER